MNFLRIFVFFIFIFNIFSYASQNDADKLAKISAKYLYEFDSTGLKEILKSGIIKNKNVQGVRIRDRLGKSIFLEYYKDDSKLVFKPVPGKYLTFDSYLSPITYNGDLIGDIVIYCRKPISIVLTDVEKRWLKEHRVIKVHNEKSWGPYNFNENGVPMGFSIDYMNLLAKIAGLDIEYVTGTWNELLEMAYDKKLDVMLNIVKLKEREKKLLFTDSYAKSITSIIAREDNTRITGLDSLRGKKVAIVKGFYSEDIIREKYPDIEIISVDNTLESLKTVLYGRADATVGKTAVIKYIMNQKGLSSLDFKGDFNIGDPEIERLNIAVNKDAKPLLSILKKAMKRVSVDEMSRLKSKWLLEDKVFKLSSYESEWLNKNPIQRVAVMDYWPHDKEGSSLHTEVLKLINKYSGTNIIPIKFDAWNKGYLKAEKGEELHGIMGLSWSKEREENSFYYSSAYDFTPCYLVVRSDNDTIKTIKDLKGKKVYLKENSITHEMVKEKIPSSKVLDVEKVDDVYEKLATEQEVPAFLGYFIDKKALIENDLKIVETIYDRYGEVAIGTNHKYDILNSIIQKAFDFIPKKELSILRQKKWGEKENLDILSRKEKEYLKNKKSIKVCTNPKWEPIEFQENDAAKGISIDILKVMEKEMGVNFEFIKTSTWGQSQQYLKQRRCDILPSANKTKSRQEYASFTTPYLNYNLAIITTPDKPLVSNLKLITDKTMARIKGSGLIEKLKGKYPYMSITETDSHKESLEKVMDGDVYFTLVTIPVFSYYKSKNAMHNLQVAGYTDMKYSLSIAVRKDDPMLLNIFNKVLQTVPKSTYDIVHEKWAKVKVVKKTDWTLLFQVAGVIILVLLFVIFNNRKLKSMVEDKTSELSHLLNSFDKNVIASKTDTNGNITYVSEAFCNITGYGEKELLGKTHSIIRHPDMPKEFFENMWSTITSGKVWKGEIKNRKKDGGFYWVDAVIGPDYDKKGELIGYNAIRQDISSKKEVEELTANLEIKVKERTADLENAKKEVETIHKHTRDSIEYAALIQCALIPDKSLFEEFFQDFFVIWQPKDTVGGDIYLFEKLREEDEALLIFVDCTGHGVPGAFVTMLVKAIERQVIAEINNNKEMEVSPAWIMGYFNKAMKNLLKQHDVNSISNAGFDGGVIYYNKKEKILKFSGAETPLFYIDSQKQFHTIKGDRYSVGYKKCAFDYEYKETVLKVEEGMQFYCTTDGYLDQNGGEKDFPFGKKRFRKIIEENMEYSMPDQQTILIYAIHEYESKSKESDRNDDMTVIGFKI